MAVPRVTLKIVQKVASSSYNLQVAKIKEYPGYMDKNVWIKSQNDEEFLLKFKLAFDVEVEDMLTSVMEHLHQGGFRVPYPIRTQSGETHQTLEMDCEDGTTSTFPFVLLKYIPGNTIFQSHCTAEELLTVSRNVGVYGGMLQQRLLVGFKECQALWVLSKTCPGKRAQLKELAVWYPENFPDLRETLCFVDDLQLRSIIAKFIDQFEFQVTPKLAKLRKAHVHGDYSDTNILLLDRTTATTSHLSEEQLLSDLGVIDFGDARHGYIVFDMAAGIAYMMTQAVSSNACPLGVAKEALIGYLQAFPLTDDELDVLFMGIVARLATSYVKGRELIATNSECDLNYVSGQSSKCPKVIELMNNIGRVDFVKTMLSS